MAIDFPNSPNVNDTYTVDDKTFIWTGDYWRVLNSPNYISTLIKDADNDTKVEVEQSADEDTVRITTGGTERYSIGTDGHIIPTANEAYDLGSASNRFRDLYLSGTSIDLGGVSITSDGTNLALPPISLTGEIDGPSDFTVSNGQGEGIEFSQTDNATYLKTVGATHLTIDSSGNVGIGTTTPAADLHIADTSTALHLQDTDGTVGGSMASMIQFTDSTGAVQSQVGLGTGTGYFLVDNNDGPMRVGTASADNLYLRTNNANQLTITSTGAVGIGTVSPTTLLHVAGSILTDDSITIGSGGEYVAGSIYSDGNWGMILRAKQASPAVADFRFANSADTERMRIDTSGRVGITGSLGIGTTAPAVALEIHGGSRVQIDVSDATYPKIGNYYSSSDNLEVGSVGGMQFVVDANGNTSENFQWRSGASNGTGTLLMQLDEASTLINYGTVQVRPSGASATMLYCYPTGLSAGARGMTIRGPLDSTSAPIQFETGNSFSFVTDGTSRLYIDNGGISKSGGSFDIQHPLDQDDTTSRLRHGFVESPYNDNVYRGTSVLDESGSASVNLDEYYGMRSGTWLALNTNPWILAAVNGGLPVTWSMEGEVLTMSGNAGETVQWIVIAERHDAHVMSDKNNHTDSNGRLILEYTREWADTGEHIPPSPEELNTGAAN